MLGLEASPILVSPLILMFFTFEVYTALRDEDAWNDSNRYWKHT